VKTRADKHPTKSSSAAAPLRTLSVVIPACNEEECIRSTVKQLHLALELEAVDHEIVVVNDHSDDTTGRILSDLQQELSCLKPCDNPGQRGFGRAIRYGLEQASGDAVIIMMADESDDTRDAIVYWRTLQEGWDCVFGSRFMKGGGTIDYPRVKYLFNRFANLFIRILFGIRLNDTTNAFKAYRREVIQGIQPLISPHFNLTVEMPLKAMVRGYSWTTVPITWRNRRTGVAKLKIREMGSRYFFIIMYVWLEKYFSRGDYRRTEPEPEASHTAPSADIHPKQRG
jgi:dolichol-phosphate mannosyltransferase